MKWYKGTATLTRHQVGWNLTGFVTLERSGWVGVISDRGNPSAYPSILWLPMTCVASVECLLGEVDEPSITWLRDPVNRFYR